MIDLAESAEACRKVVRTDQHPINSGHTDNGLDVLDRVCVLSLHYDRYASISSSYVFFKSESIPVGPPNADAACPLWRVFREANNCFGLLSRVYLRRDYPGCPDVKRLLDGKLPAGGQANKAWCGSARALK